MIFGHKIVNPKSLNVFDRNLAAFVSLGLATLRIFGKFGLGRVSSLSSSPV